MAKEFIKTAAAYAVTVAISVAVVSQIMNGEPEPLRATVSGLAFGLTVAAMQTWQKKRRARSNA